MILNKGADFKGISERFHISPRMACLIRNRDIIGDEQIEQYLNGTIADLHDGMLMKDMALAVEILTEKIRTGERIRIIGDYDIDGVNATYILLEGLKYLGADVDTDIPDRMKDGYGLNKSLVDRALDDGIDTIITCDNGIAAKEEITYGKEMGMTIIVTDHHEVPYEDREGVRYYKLPPADAVVDPKQETCTYPFKDLCGAAVAYKLVEALLEVNGQDVEDVDYLMENVAIATVGDVMDLVGENRIFVKQGLEMLKHTKSLGLKALLECNGLEMKHLSAYHIGFVIGPCLNASGRLDTAKRALELLCVKTKKEADILAGDLKALNDSRKEMTQIAVEEAIFQIDKNHMEEDKVLVIYLPQCHESLAGIVAGRIRECYYKPVFVLTSAKEGIKGSGRSIEAYHMYEKLNECRELLTKFGGHKLAAGLSMEEANLEAFRKRINAKANLSEEDLTEKVLIDMQMPFLGVTQELVKELELLEPFGKGNTKPVFAERNVEFLKGWILGKNRNVLKFRVKDANQTEMDAIYFGDAQKMISYMEGQFGKSAAKQVFAGGTAGIKMAVTYYPGINEYMGRKSLQITILNYK